MRARLRAVPDGTLKAWSAQLVTRLQARTELWGEPGTVAIFGGLRSEPDLVSTFLPWLRERGPLGVWEPAGTAVLPLAELDVILVPGLAFVRKTGARLGRGGGFYDRLLSRPEVRARRVGIVFELQLLPDLPRESHDVCVADIVTEM